MSSAGRNSSPRPGSRRIENRAQLAPRFVGRRGEALAVRVGEPPSDCRCEAGAFLHALEPAGYPRATGPEASLRKASPSLARCSSEGALAPGFATELWTLPRAAPRARWGKL